MSPWMNKKVILHQQRTHRSFPPLRIWKRLVPNTNVRELYHCPHNVSKASAMFEHDFAPYNDP